MSRLKLSIVSPERRVVEGVETPAVTLTGVEGQLQILPGHAPFIGALETGLVRYQNAEGKDEEGVISSGFFEVSGDVVSVMAETFELCREIDIERAKRAQQKAEKALSDVAIDEQNFRKYQLKLQRALIRQQLGGGNA